MIQLQSGGMAEAIEYLINTVGPVLVILIFIAILGFIALLVFFVGFKKNDRRESREHKESYDMLVRPKYRYLGGVCEAIGRKNNIAPIWIRVLFIVSFFFFPPSLLIYIILCFAIKSYKKIDLKV